MKFPAWHPLSQYGWFFFESYQLFVRSYLTSSPNDQSKMEEQWQKVKPKVVVKLTKKEESQQETVGTFFKAIWTVEELKHKQSEAEKKG